MTRPARLWLFIPLLVFIGLVLFLMRGLQLDPSAVPSALLDRPLPAFSLPRLEADAPPISERDWHGRKALVNVWATWCVTCRIEHPYLMTLASRGIPLYGINYKDDPVAARRWLQEKGNPYQMTVVDQRGKLGIDLGVSGAPETYLVDSSGIIRYKHTGDLNERVWQDKLKPVWDSLP